MTAEQEISATVQEILGNWIAAEADADRPRMKAYATQIDGFAKWAVACGLKLPSVNGQVAAGYLLEIAADGASLSDLTQAAAAITFLYDVIFRRYLDLHPIYAVLALIKAQTAPSRVLN